MGKNPVFCEEKKKNQCISSSKEHNLSALFVCLFILTKPSGLQGTNIISLYTTAWVGFTPSQEVAVTTLAGFPERGAIVATSVLNRTAIDVRWEKPSKNTLHVSVSRLLACTLLPVAAMEHHEQGSLEKEVFIWVYGFRGLESILQQGHAS